MAKLAFSKEGTRDYNMCVLRKGVDERILCSIEVQSGI